MSGYIARRSSLLFAVIATIAVMAPGPATADPQPVAPADRAAVEACLALVTANAEKAAQASATEDERPGPEGRLAAASKDAASRHDSCIGAVTLRCQQEPGGATTHGMIACNEREWAVWDERLNRVYKEALDGAEPRLVASLRKTQRNWLAWREGRCALPGIVNEGGSIVGPLFTGCMLETTARQALWLEHSE